MLRITANTEGRRLVLEGSLAGPWVDTLELSWRDALGRRAAPEIAVDVTDVTFVDPRGRNLLAAIHAEGGALFSNGGMNVTLIQEIARDDRRSRLLRSRSPRSVLWLLAAVVPLFFMVSCSSARASQPSDDAAGQSRRPAVAVDVEPVAAGDVADAVDVVGSLAPKFSADVKSEVSGTVAAVYVTEWVAVRAGAPLARLNTAEGESAVDAAKAIAAQARVAETRALRELDRALQLKQYGLITAQALDDARSAREAAEAMTAATHAQVRAAEVRLSKSFITAPIAGVIAFRGVNAGDRVENIGSGDPMFRIVDNRVLDLTVSVPSARLAAVRVGQRLDFTVDALAGRLFTGQVMFINPSVDEVSRAGKVVAEVRNPDAALKGGLFVKGRIVVSSRADVLQAPRAALLNWNVANGTAEVFVVRDGTAEKRTVRTGPAAGESVAVVAGLASGDRVVTRGAFALKSGDRVTVSEGGK